MEHEKAPKGSTTHSAVESIVGALSDLERDLDGMNAKVDEMKKRLMAHSNEEIEKLKQAIISMASEEAGRIVEGAREEAEAESSQITKEAEKSLATIKKNIDASFDRAVESIVRTVLGQEQEAKARAAKARKA